MIDINKLFDSLKIRMYYEYLINRHSYAETESPYHKDITAQVVETYIDPLSLPKDAVIIDVGPGPGYFFDEMVEKRKYTNVLGITINEEEIEEAKKKGYEYRQYDMSFLPQKDGFTDESVDFIFARHVLEHSPFPMITLFEYNRLLKQGSKMYLEFPAPDCERMHEYNLNHYSILGHNQWAALLNRAGFEIDFFNILDFDIKDTTKTDEEGNISKEKFYTVMVTKTRPLDIH